MTSSCCCSSDMDYYLLKDTSDGSDPSDISKLDPFYCAGERLEKTYYELVFKSMQNELLEILVTALAQIDTDSTLLNILKELKEGQRDPQVEHYYRL